MATLLRLGSLQTGTTQSREFGIYGFQGGLNVKSLPQALDDSDLAIAQDVYLTPTGGVQLRNGMTRYGVPFATGGPVYLARFFQDVVGGVPQDPELTQLLAQNGDNLYSVGQTANTFIGKLGTNTDPMTWARIQNPSGQFYLGKLTDCLVICTGSGGPYVWDGTHLYTPAGWSAAASASWCAVVNGILWFGGIPATPNQIFGSGDGINDSMETLPAKRNFIFSSPVMGLVGFASFTATSLFQTALVIGLNSSIAVLFGTGPTDFQLQETPFADPVTAGRTMLCYDGAVFFLGHSAAYVFNLGSVPQPVSQKVEPWILNRPYTSIPTYPGFPMAFNRALSWAAVYNNRLHLGYCSQAQTPDTILVYDLNLQGWTVLRSNPGIASMILLDAPGDPNPYVALVGGTNGQIYTWDVQTGGTSPVLDDTTPVLAQLQTKFYKIGVPGTNKALERFYPEFYLSGTFTGAFTLSLDYGAAQVISPLNLFYSSFFMVWDVSEWDEAEWGAGGGPQYLSYTAPTTRIDYPGSQGEAFSFGVKMTQPLAPWIFAGGSGAYAQRGRT